ncbi:AraC-type DNA-binding protein [Filimonas lacunae]|uniref:AraC-type DNA-binding protein n=1 Tax=Filimonas lacunae TaxID=477680 RepID=A0A173MDY7_9BACT|nr:helix-turn-helix domain-containing protein [Filimonas lacunae]BAV05651.1 transcriptional regulator, AraC family [Filimonas lacunae]SIT29044.1 AraC-type DNA-binding protein [Filimonas lacunae]
MNYIIIIGAFQSLVALWLFVAHRQKRPADTLLNWILLCIFTHLCIKFTIFAADGHHDIKTAFNTFIDLAYGPLLWMYTSKISNSRYQPMQHWYLLVPTLLACIFYFSILLYLVADGTHPAQLLNGYNQVTAHAINLFNILFPVLCLKKAARLPQFWRSERRLIQKIAVIWLGLGILSFLLTYIITPLELFNADTLNITIRIIAYSLMVVISLFIIRYRLARLAGETAAAATVAAAPAFVEEMAAEPAIINEEENTATLPLAAKRTVLTSQQQTEVTEKLVALMEKKKTYTDPDLTLEKLAAESQIPRHHISEALNHHLGKTFYQFINDFRMKEVLHLLDKCKKQQITPGILSLAFEAGFNSKSTFNQYFKKATGYTPSEYLKKANAPGKHYTSSTILALE